MCCSVLERRNREENLVSSSDRIGPTDRGYVVLRERSDGYHVSVSATPEGPPFAVHYRCQPEVASDVALDVDGPAQRSRGPAEVFRDSYSGRVRVVQIARIEDDR